MSRSVSKILKNLQYKEKNQIQKDADYCLQRVVSLQPQAANFVSNDGSQSTILKLTGTIPITYKGNCYNIPVDIWLPSHFPDEPPICFVTPTHAMHIKPRHKNVDAQGMVYLPYLHAWKRGRSDLVRLVSAMISVFSADPPLYKTKAAKQSNPKLAKFDSEESKVPNLLKNLQYEDRYRVQREAEYCLQALIPHLQPQVANFVSNDGSESTILKLTGTIPITYCGSLYNIPVDIWLPLKFPDVPPICHVIPTHEMRIKPRHKHVDRQGMVYLPYLYEWEPGRSDLVQITTSMISVFSVDPPVYAKAVFASSEPGHNAYIQAVEESSENMESRNAAIQAVPPTSEESSSPSVVAPIEEESRVSYLECQICYEKFDENIHVPRLLLCGHTLCQVCIDWLETDMIVKCPNKDGETQLGEKGALGLNKNFALLNVLEGMQADPPTGKNETWKCDNDCGATATKFCEDCEFNYCDVCCTTVHKPKVFRRHKISGNPKLMKEHKSDDISSISELAEEAKESLRETSMELPQEEQRLSEIDGDLANESENLQNDCVDDSLQIAYIVQASMDEISDDGRNTLNNGT